MKNQNETKSKDFNLSSVTETITPLKDHVIHHNEFKYDLKKGEKAEVNKIFIETLKTEKVI